MKKILVLFLLALPALACAQERMIHRSVVVAAPAAEAFRAWTTKDGIESFFAPEAVVDPRPDGAFDIHMNPYAEPGMKGADGMRVLGIQEGRMISFTWNAPPSLPEARKQRTAVIVRTEPVDDTHTRVSVSHVGWGSGGEWDQAYDYFDKAWGRVLDLLKTRYDDGKPVDWKPFLERLRASTPSK
jgi:uncharacterized protein YndB with AHSA1/START domain